MAQEKPNYEENNEFNKFAIDVVNKYPEEFQGVDPSKICCVNITNKERGNKDEPGQPCWRIEAVKMPQAMHAPYGWYITMYSDEWDEMSEKHKVAVVGAALHGISDEEGKVIQYNTKMHYTVAKTLGVGFKDNPDIPHLLRDDVEWKK